MNTLCDPFSLPTVDATVILALATVALACGTFWLAFESRQASFRQIGVQTWLEFIKRFDSEDMKRERKALAKWLKNYDPTRHDEISEVVLLLFEDVGIAYKLGCLNKELADESFGFYVCRWWCAAKPCVEQERKRHGDDKSLFENFEKIAVLMRLDRETIDEQERLRFLDDEIKLTLD